jgi:uncharacterized repeat protein (TIGR03803 family)
VGTDGTNFRLLHTFLGGASDGAKPESSLILDGSGTLFGTTKYGGSADYGTVFSVRTDGTDFRLLHTFVWGPGGVYPVASLILDGSGNLYGTTELAGSDSGTVFRLRTDGTNFRVLHTFGRDPSDGVYPYASLILDGSGNLYGTTWTGGTSGLGTVFSLKTDGTSFQLLHTFAGGPSDGAHPWASLILDLAGNLYGTTHYGGRSGNGTAYSVKTDGTNFHLLHSFVGGAGDGLKPHASLILDGSGNLYGTTYRGGTSNLGTVFSVKTDGTDFHLLHSFVGDAGDGAYPYASLILDGSGNLYGTTNEGGASNQGTVFSVKTDGTKFHLLHNFVGGASDGASPSASLILDGSGNLYGTTLARDPLDYGAVFSVTTDGTKFQLLHAFQPGAGEGLWPYASLTLDSSGNLYGTTYWGGTADGGTEFTLPSLTFTPPQLLFTLSPCRLFDTRDASGPAATPPVLGASETRSLIATGKCGIPAGASALALNVTAVAPRASGVLTLFAGDLAAAPVTNNVSFRSGRTRANNSIVSLAKDGSGTLKVLNDSPGLTDVVVDVSGYYQ